MLTMFSPASLEAQKLISVSIGKINASRVTRTGTSLHKSLLVASVLHRARNVYLEEERERAARYPCPPSPELTVTPVCHLKPTMNCHNSAADHTISDKENRLQCHEDQVALAERVGEENRLPLGEANTGNSNVTHTTTTTTTVTSLTNTCTITTTTSTSSSRKRRRVSDQETAAAISSILPKRLRSELKEDSLRSDFSNTTQKFVNHQHTEDVTITPILHQAETKSQSKPASKQTTNLPDVLFRLSPTREREDNLSTNHVPEDVSSRLLPLHEAASVEQDVPTATAEQDPAADDKKEGGGSSSEDSDSDGEDSASDTSGSSCEEEMEVDQLTSLVSYFGFSQSPKQADYCLVPSLHSQQGPHAVALTA